MRVTAVTETMPKKDIWQFLRRNRNRVSVGLYTAGEPSGEDEEGGEVRSIDYEEKRAQDGALIKTIGAGARLVARISPMGGAQTVTGGVSCSCEAPSD